MRALIVDDSRFIREHLRQMLERMNVLCVQATDGQDALALLDQGALFDMMFCDVNMPKMNGLECVKKVRERTAHSPMRVMMVTTEMDHAFIERALDCGADEFLMKPFTVEGLREKLVLLGLDGV